MNAAGILLDTGPLVALLSKNDANHDRARRVFAECAPPFRCCEAVVAEACFLMGKVNAAGPAEVVALGARGVYSIAISAEEHWTHIEALLKKYSDRPISLADACLIRCAEIHQEARILTFDSDFSVYRWARNRRFERLDAVVETSGRARGLEALRAIGRESAERGLTRLSTTDIDAVIARTRRARASRNRLRR